MMAHMFAVAHGHFYGPAPPDLPAIITSSLKRGRWLGTNCCAQIISTWPHKKYTILADITYVVRGDEGGGGSEIAFSHFIVIFTE